jgi:hypothetical protein
MRSGQKYHGENLRKEHELMKLLNKVMWGLGLLAVLMLLMSVVAPRTTHALVSTLVTVSNTTANPVPVVSSDSAGQHPFTATCTGVNAGTTASCTVAVPAGIELVIQNIVLETSMNTNGVFGVTTSVGGTSSLAFAQPPVSDHQTWSVTAYADPSTNITFEVTFPSGGGMGGTFIVYVQGYYVSVTGSSSLSLGTASSGGGGWDINTNGNGA